jgi:multidrug efflux pump subunit AcrB
MPKFALRYPFFIITVGPVIMVVGTTSIAGMGVIMMTGTGVSNSILIVEFATLLHEQGKSLLEAVVQSCKIRLRPILMTSLATLLGMIPMAIGLESGSEQYAPLARAIIGGLGVSVVVTVFLVPAVYLIVHGRRENKIAVAQEG